MCGLPASGKTTAARHIAENLGAVRLCPDEWMAALDIDFYDGATRERLEVQFWGLAQELLQRGICVVLESGFWLRSDREEKLTGARRLGVAVEIHFLDVPFDELWRRIERRNVESGWGTVPIVRSDLEKWASLFQAPDPHELALFDPPSRRDF